MATGEHLSWRDASPLSLTRTQDGVWVAPYAWGEQEFRSGKFACRLKSATPCHRCSKQCWRACEMQRELMWSKTERSAASAEKDQDKQMKAAVE